MKDKLLNLMGELGLGEARPGTVRARSDVFDDPSEALRVFKEFGGEGWLCLAKTREILILPGDAGNVPDDGWPVGGELADGNRSLRLARSGAGWCVSVLEADPEGEGITLFRSFLRRGGGTLRYEVSCENSVREGPGEFRASEYRFTGFGRKDDE